MTIRVLLAEPDSALRTTYADAFHATELDLTAVATPAQALEALATGADVLVAEIGGGGGMGPGLLRDARDRDPDLPIVVLTGTPELESAMTAVNLGAFRYLVKPVSASTLEDVIRRAVLLREISRLSPNTLAGDETDAIRTELMRRFDAMLGGIRMAYQPIVRTTDHHIRGFEALLRPEPEAFAGAEEFLHAALALDRTRDLGRAVRARVAEDSLDLPGDGTLFVNLLPTDLLDPELYAPDAPLSAIAPRVVLELTERSPLDAVSGLTDRVDRLRGLGFRVALDDVGAGYAGLASLTQLEPDVIKLDRSLIRDVDGSPHRREVVRSLVALCRSLHIGLIGEGVERAEEFDALRDLEVEQLQGYYFAMPAPVDAWKGRFVS